MNVVLKVSEFKANSNWQKSGITVTPVGDILYSIKVPDEENFLDEEGNANLTTNGIRIIIKGLHMALSLDADEEF